MKNLKKVLALVLVVATLMGFATVAGAKTADFTDASSIKNDEAVDVMTTLGVIVGKPGGGFDPNGNVTRAEMAKMVSYIMNGGTDVGPLYSAANVFTDCGYHWARGYIAYAANVKLIVGVGNNKFNPDGNVTGTEAAKMLLCALGYEADREGIKGATWASKTMSLADQAGLLDGFEKNYDFNRPLSRDGAAQMMLNALKAPTVTYLNDAGSITVNGATIDLGGNRATYVTSNRPYSTAISGDSVPSSEMVDTNKTQGNSMLELGEKCFEGDLTLNAGDSGHDAFGRPADTWAYKSVDIGTYLTKDPVVTFDTTTKQRDVFKALNISGLTIGTDKFAVMDTVWVDGVRAAGYLYDENTDTWSAKAIHTPKTDSYNDYEDAVLVQKGEADDALGTGTGVKVEIYSTSRPNHFTMVVVHEFLAKVNSITKADSKKDIDRKVNLVVYNYEQDKVLTDTDPFNNKNLSYETEDFAKGDYVLVTVANDDVQDAKSPEKIEDVTVTSYKSDTVTAGGTSYNYGARAESNGRGTTNGKDTGYVMRKGNTYDFLLDSCGNIVRGVKHAGISDYVYILTAKKDTSVDTDFEDQSIKVKYVDVTGKVTNNVRTEWNSDTSKNPTAGAWYVVREDSTNDGWKTFEKLDDNRSGEANSHKLSRYQAKLAEDDNGVAITADNKTVFVISSVNSEGKTIYRAYTGIARVPGFDPLVGASATDPTVFAVAGTKSTDYAEVVYIDATGGTSKNEGDDDVVYLLTTDGHVNENESGSGEYVTYDVIRDGETSTANVSKSLYDSLIEADGTYTGKLVKISSIDPDGTITSVDEIEDQSGYVRVEVKGDETTKISLSDGVMVITGAQAVKGDVAADGKYRTDDETKVYIYDGEDVISDEGVGALEGIVTPNKNGDAYIYIVYRSATNAVIDEIYTNVDIKAETT